MAFKMNYRKGDFPFKKNGETDPPNGKDKKYPKGYTEKDIKFLKEQREDVVRYEDLDEAGKKIWHKVRGEKYPK
jgi:hypothetical protein